MTYRRKADAHSLRLLFVIGLLFFGILLPLASAVASPAAAGDAAATLPTAHVRIPTPAAVVAPALLATDDDPQLVVAAAPTLAADPIAPTDAPPSPAPAVGEAPQAVPTLTNTPIELAPIEPVATLFPTVPPQAAPDQAAPAQAGAVPPIIMYHYVRFVDQASDELGFSLSVTPDDFGQQMAWLHDQGYAGVRMDVVSQCMRGEAACPAKAVALTFDDGYEDAYTNVLPMLQQYGLSATFYIVTNFVGQPGYMTWDQVAALRDAGMEIGSHTIDHFDLRTLDPNEMLRQVAQSKADLEAKLAIHVNSFCYPAGFYDAAIEEAVRSSGYLNATTTRWDDDTSDIMALPRRRMAGGTSMDSFVAIVQGW